MIERIDKNTVRIKHKGNYYYLDMPESGNLIIVEEVFLRGFREGKLKVWNKGLTKETDERVKKYANKLMGNVLALKHRKKISIAHLGKKQSEETKEKRREKMKRWWDKNKDSEKTRKRNRKIGLANHISLKGKLIGDKNPMRNPKIAKKCGLANRGKIISTEVRKRNSIFHKNLWKNPIYRDKTIKAILKGLMKRPTSYEKKISELCIENNLPFIYTGDGTFLIGHKNPDFVDKEERIAIEVYHIYFKIRDFGSCEEYEKQRSEYFAKYGYKTIFIRTEEIEDKNWKNICLNKINKKIIVKNL